MVYLTRWSLPLRGGVELYATQNVSSLQTNGKALWHKRFGHPSNKLMKKMVKFRCVEKAAQILAEILKSKKDVACTECVQGILVHRPT